MTPLKTIFKWKDSLKDKRCKLNINIFSIFTEQMQDSQERKKKNSSPQELSHFPSHLEDQQQVLSTVTSLHLQNLNQKNKFRASQADVQHQKHSRESDSLCEQ